MTETVSPAPESPRLARLAILDNFASKDMPGRQSHIQDCVDQILAKVSTEPEAG